MANTQEWLNAKVKGSAHAGLLLDPIPAVAGGGSPVIVALGSEATKVVYVGERHGGTTLRVGFAAKDRWANEEVEDAVESNGGTMTEFLEDAMEADDALEYPVQHFHEAGWFHFACDLPAADLDRVWYYLDGYARAILPIVSKAKE
jgi:hypothetical protein